MDFFSHLSPMCSGGVTVTIIGVDVDAAVEPILTLFSGSNSARFGVSGTFLYNEFIYVIALSIPYGRKFWRGIYFGGLAVLRAIRQYFIRQKLHSVMSSLLRNHSLCTSCSYIRQSNRRHGVYH